MHSLFTFLLTLALLYTCPFSAVAAPLHNVIDGYYFRRSPICFTTLSPGGCDWEVAEEGIVIKKRNSSTYYLWITTWGANGHSCQYAALAQWQKGQLVSKKKMKSSNNTCEVKVTFHGGSANLSSEEESYSCRDFCGARATLEAKGLKRKQH